MKKIIRITVISLLVFSMAACSLLSNKSGAQKVAEDLQKKTGYTSFKVGGSILASSQEYYSDYYEYLTQYLYGLSAEETAEYMESTVEEAEGLLAFYNITKTLSNLIPNVQDVEDGTVNSVYLGETNADEQGNDLAYGIFIFEFDKDVAIDQEQITQSNEQIAYLEYLELYPEYFYVNGKYLVSVDKTYLDDYGLSFEGLKANLDDILN